MASGQTNLREIYLFSFVCLFSPLQSAKEQWEQEAVNTIVGEKAGYQLPSPSLFQSAFHKGNIIFLLLFHAFRNNKHTRIGAAGFYWLMVWCFFFFFETFVIFLCFKVLSLQDSTCRNLVLKPYLFNATSTCLLVRVTEVFLFCVQCNGSQMSRAAVAMLENRMFCPKFPWKCLQLKPCLIFVHHKETLKKSCLALIYYYLFIFPVKLLI